MVSIKFSSFDLEGIPKLHWYGEEAGSNILVMELLDSNIEELLQKAKWRKFTTMTILLIIDQMVRNFISLNSVIVIKVKICAR